MSEAILVPLSDWPGSECALVPATKLARALQARLVLLRLTCPERGEDALGHPAHPATEEARRHLEGIAYRLNREGFEVEHRMVCSRSASVLPATIAQVAAAQGAHWMVLCSAARSGWPESLSPSIGDQMRAVQQARVLIVQPETRYGPWEGAAAHHCLLVPLDGSPAAEAALPAAVELAQALETALVLLQPVTPRLLPRPERIDATLRHQYQESQSYLSSLARQVERGGVTVQTRVRIGLPVDAILYELAASGAAMIMMAEGHRTGWQPGAPGSVSEQLVRDALCPLVLVQAGPPTRGRSLRPEAVEP